ncbi:Na+/H+ antiporter subunit E [Microbacterium amylolyticum]|uniref:Multicomponent Na+:H+ antiporter subunit E n=1 Tax=Microbacterium amylolyticum TaxID=936337 RepID=A0ABS4ZHX7_9MICO|nr:Na+/H+ antiporter subunit E [Microbacterium amylolyticum]MBP2436886.1 multicomponent Na+:H+ antiporter subunit E [Microbacterium amylolyticum]
MRTRFWVRRSWAQLPFFLWLVLLWMLLWGQLTWLAFVTGIAVATYVTTAFRLPTAELSGRFNPFWLLVFVVHFLAELIVGALQVAWQTISPRPTATSIVRAPLRIDDDLTMTHTSVAMSLVPGTAVIEADRENRVLYLHALGVTTPAGADRVRSEVLAWEMRIVRALGSRDAYTTVRAKAPTYEKRRAAQWGVDV